jgi:hypothetical protein
VIRVTPEIVAVFDKACRAMTTNEATEALREITLLRRKSEDEDLSQSLRWAREAVCYWAGYFSHDVRLRVERLYMSEHPIFGSAMNGPANPKQALMTGIRIGESGAELPWLRRPPPYPDEP